MATHMTMDRILEMKGKPVYDSQHNKIGGVEEIFLDEATNQPEWIGIGTGGFFKSEKHVVPVEGAHTEGDGLLVPFTKDQVKNTPSITSDEIPESTERELYQAYGMKPSEQRSPSTMGEGTPQGKARGRTGDTDTTMTRSEEELRVGKREQDAGRVRLRKYVETEPASADVELRRETAKVERKPVNRPVGDTDFGEEEVEVDLREERPVVGKEAVAKEEVGIRKEEQRRKEQVTGDVRKERIEAEEDPKDPGDRRRGS